MTHKYISTEPADRLFRKPTQNPKDPATWPAAIRAKKGAETARRNKLEAAQKLTPDHAIRFLLAHAKRIKFGQNQYAGTVNLIRMLIQERSDLFKQVDKLEEQLAKLTTPKVKRTRSHGTEGQGDWGGGDPQDYLK